MSYLAWGAIFLMVASGCSSRPSLKPTIDRDQSANLRAIQDAYFAATVALQRPPRNLDELTAHLPSDTDRQAVFRSPRDGEPYVIVWGIDLRIPPKPTGPDNPFAPVVAYERQGVNGERLVLTAEEVVRMSESDFARAISAPSR